MPGYLAHGVCYPTAGGAVAYLGAWYRSIQTDAPAGSPYIVASGTFNYSAVGPAPVQVPILWRPNNNLRAAYAGNIVLQPCDYSPDGPFGLSLSVYADLCAVVTGVVLFGVAWRLLRRLPEAV